MGDWQALPSVQRETLGEAPKEPANRTVAPGETGDVLQYKEGLLIAAITGSMSKKLAEPLSFFFIFFPKVGPKHTPKRGHKKKTQAHRPQVAHSSLQRSQHSHSMDMYCICHL